MRGNAETTTSATDDVTNELEVLHGPLASLIAELAAIARHYDVYVTLTVGGRPSGDDPIGGESTP